MTPLQPSVVFNIETSNLVCSLISLANQMNGFFMKCNTELKNARAKVNYKKFKRK